MTFQRILPLLFIFFFQGLFAQSLDITPTIEPEFFAADDEITITYDVTGTYMANWSEAWLWSWLPNNGGTDAPSNVNPASANASLSDDAKFSKSVDGGNTFFSLKMTPTNFFTGISGQVTAIGFLIKGNDWSDGQSIDYVTEVGGGLRIVVDSPTGNFGFYNPTDIININVRTSEIANIDISIDDSSIANTAADDELMVNHPVINDEAIHTIKITASNTDETVFTTYNYLVPPAVVQSPLPAGTRNGINYNEAAGEVTLVLEAPTKENVFVIGDFNDWQIDSDYFMRQDGEQFWITLTDLDPGTLYRYQYLIDGDLRIADPYTERVNSPFDDAQIISENRYPGLPAYPNDKTSEAVTFLQIAPDNDYQWQTQNYTRPAVEDLVIYELLVRDFTDARTFNAVFDRLDYLQELGVNAIELMPVMEFEGNLSWGYNPAFMFSVDKYYGTENELKKLIDEAHARGMAVILDIVLNHAFGRSPLVRLNNDDTYGPPTNDNVWLNRNARHDFNVGYDFNHESDYTKAYADRVNEFWINEYKIDGYRFDLSKGFTQKNTLGNIGAWGAYDASRIALLKRMADNIWALDPESYIILEHFADNSEEKELANYGMLLWGNMTGAYRSASSGNAGSIANVFHESRGWDQPNLVGYMESHDEERIMWEITKGSTTTEEALEGVKAASVFFFLVPGPKLIWQFEELGYDEELNNDRLGIKPTHWEYLDDPNRKKTYDTFSSLINLKTKTGLIDTDYFEWSPNGSLKWLTIDHPDTKIVAYGNFSKSETTGNINWPTTGTWHHYFVADSTLAVDAAGEMEVTLAPGEIHVFTSQPTDNYIGYNPFPVFNTTPGPEEPEPMEEITDIELAPNPSLDEVKITFPLGTDKLSIYNTAGILVATFGINPETTILRLNFAFYPAGYYTIVARSGDKDIKSELFFKHR